MSVLAVQYNKIQNDFFLSVFEGPIANCCRLSSLRSSNEKQRTHEEHKKIQYLIYVYYEKLFNSLNSVSYFKVLNDDKLNPNTEAHTGKRDLEICVLSMKSRNVCVVSK